jgi:probable phosphoglycerate mutase
VISLILARHGNTFERGQIARQIGAQTDLSLTTEGKKQAEAMGDYFLSVGISPKAIYAGTLKRQIESAEILARRFKTKLYLGEPALTEIDYGDWEGLTSEELMRRWPKEYADWTEGGKWAEAIFGKSLQFHLDGVEKWIGSLRKMYRPGEAIVAVTSNGLIRFFNEEWRRLALTKQMETLKVKTGHFCELQLYPDCLKVKSWNARIP